MGVRMRTFYYGRQKFCVKGVILLTDSKGVQPSEPHQNNGSGLPIPGVAV
jgi:hypothetical protein